VPDFQRAKIAVLRLLNESPNLERLNGFHPFNTT
jgi:hypothetical protein